MACRGEGQRGPKAHAHAIRMKKRLEHICVSTQLCGVFCVTLQRRWTRRTWSPRPLAGASGGSGSSSGRGIKGGLGSGASCLLDAGMKLSDFVLRRAKSFLVMDVLASCLLFSLMPDVLRLWCGYLIACLPARNLKECNAWIGGLDCGVPGSNYSRKPSVLNKSRVHTEMK